MRTGGCQCGGVRYEISGEPERIYVCHCSECRHQSASAFGISVIVKRVHFRLVKGAPKVWSRKAEISGELHCAFCPDCGSRLWHEPKGEDILSVKGGSLDEPPDLSRVFHIWTKSKLPGVVIPEGARTWPGEPD